MLNIQSAEERRQALYEQIQLTKKPGEESIKYAPKVSDAKKLDEFQQANLEILKKQAEQQGGGYIDIKAPQALMNESLKTTIDSTKSLLEQGKGLS